MDDVSLDTTRATKIPRRYELKSLRLTEEMEGGVLESNVEGVNTQLAVLIDSIRAMVEANLSETNPQLAGARQLSAMSVLEDGEAYAQFSRNLAAQLDGLGLSSIEVGSESGQRDEKIRKALIVSEVKSYVISNLAGVAASVDHQTGLLTAEVADGMVKNLLKQGIPVTVITFDMKNLKALNTVFEMAGADEIIESFFRRMEGSGGLRSSDFMLYRRQAGGDEGIIVLPGADSPQAVEAFLSRIYDKVLGDAFEYNVDLDTLEKIYLAFEDRRKKVTDGTLDLSSKKDSDVAAFLLADQVLRDSFPGTDDLGGFIHTLKSLPGAGERNIPLKVKLKFRGGAAVFLPENCQDDDFDPGSVRKKVVEPVLRDDWGKRSEGIRSLGVDGHHPENPVVVEVYGAQEEARYLVQAGMGMHQIRLADVAGRS